MCQNKLYPVKAYAVCFQEDWIGIMRAKIVVVMLFAPAGNNYWKTNYCSGTQKKDVEKNPQNWSLIYSITFVSGKFYLIRQVLS